MVGGFLKKKKKKIAHHYTSISLTRQKNLSVCCSQRTTPLPPPPLDAPRVAPRPPHARGGAVTVPGCSSALRHSNFPKPCTNFQGTASTERSGTLSYPGTALPPTPPKNSKSSEVLPARLLMTSVNPSPAAGSRGCSGPPG